MSDEEPLPDTQQVNECDFTQSQKTPTVVWGKLFSLKSSLNSCELTKDEYIFGRAKNNDIEFTAHSFKPSCFNTISKQHFKITRELLTGSSGIEKTIVFLEDLSQNGTFVNGEKLDKNKKVRLKNDDVISMSSPDKMKVYIFFDEDGLKSSDFPLELTDKFIMSRTLGSGACGEVKMAICKTSERKVAIKMMSKSNFDNHDSVADAAKIRTEIEILRQLQHPGVIKMIDFIDTPSKVYLVLELMEGGDLLDRIKKKGRIPEKQAKIIFFQVALTVQYLHMNGIAHRDLKPENILLFSKDDETLVKVTDFGLSKLMNVSVMKTFCGTPMYVAPEVLINHGRGMYTNQVDIWSMGVILYCCLGGITPFRLKDSMSLSEQIIKGQYTFPKVFANNTLSATNMIKRMMTVNPDKRIKIDEILNHSWFMDRSMRQTVRKLFSQYSCEDTILTPLSEDVEQELQHGVSKRAKISIDDENSNPMLN